MLQLYASHLKQTKNNNNLQQQYSSLISHRELYLKSDNAQATAREIIRICVRANVLVFNKLFCCV